MESVGRPFDKFRRVFRVHLPDCVILMANVPSWPATKLMGLPCEIRKGRALSRPPLGITVVFAVYCSGESETVAAAETLKRITPD